MSKKSGNKGLSIHNRWAMRAAAEGAVPYLKLALELGADPNAALDWMTEGNPPSKKTRRSSPLIEAAVGGHKEAVQVLLEAGADPRLEIDGRTPLASAKPSIAKLMLGKDPGAGEALRTAFAEGLSDKAVFSRSRDWEGEFRKWLSSGGAPYTPDFGGVSLVALLGRVLAWSEGDDKARVAALFKELCESASAAPELFEAFHAAVRAEEFKLARALVGRGSGAGWTRDELDRMIASIRPDEEKSWLRPRLSPLEVDVVIALVRLGADAGLAFDSFRKHPEDAIRLAEAAPKSAAAMADADGCGLLWHAIDGIHGQPNDPKRFAACLGLATVLLKEPSTRVLLGNGLGDMGPPVVGLARIVTKSFPFTNKKREAQFEALEKSIEARALGEAGEFDNEGLASSGPLPSGMNVLHLAVMCGIGKVSNELLERVSKVGRPSLAKMLGQKATIAKFPLRRSDCEEKVAPFDLALDMWSSNLAIRLAGMVDFQLKSGGTGAFQRLCEHLGEDMVDDSLRTLERMFDLGADPDARMRDGKTVREFLRDWVQKQERRGAAAVNFSKGRSLSEPEKEIYERQLVKIDEAFINAAAKKGRKVEQNVQSKPKPSGGRETL